MFNVEMSLHTLALLSAIVGLSKVGIRFYDLMIKRLSWEPESSEAVSFGGRIIIVYLKLLISTLPIWSFKIANRSLLWIHNILVVLIYLSAILVNQKLQNA